MEIEYSGYTEAQGFFSFKIPVDETKTDYEIIMKNGSVLRQSGPFQSVTRDWNWDGDVYTLFGAYFYCDGRGEFISPVDMIRLVVDGNAEIPGIVNPLQKPSLGEQINKADQRSLQQSRPGSHDQDHDR